MSGFKLPNDLSPRAALDTAGQDPAGRSGQGDYGDQLLGLTVHSMPDPGQAIGGDEKQRFSGRLKMIIVLLVCAAPVMVSYLTYYIIRPEGRRNFGELITPQRPLPDQVGTNLAGAAVNLKALKGQWLLVSVAGGDCDEACTRHLYLQRQLRESLGKDKDRVDWVWLISDDKPVSDKLRPALANATVLRVPQAQLASWLQADGGRRLSEHLYLVDPMGNWMMRFPSHLDLPAASKAKRDIERLLRASASWDQPGR
jgi:hypothetical protein